MIEPGVFDIAVAAGSVILGSYMVGRYLREAETAGGQILPTLVFDPGLMKRPEDFEEVSDDGE